MFFRLFNGYLRRVSSRNLTKSPTTVDQRGHGGFFENRRLSVRNDVSAPNDPDIVRNSHDPVRIVPSQVSIDQRLGHSGGDRGRAPGRYKDFLTELGQLRCGFDNHW